MTSVHLHQYRRKRVSSGSRLAGCEIRRSYWSEQSESSRATTPCTLTRGTTPMSSCLGCNFLETLRIPPESWRGPSWSWRARSGCLRVRAGFVRVGFEVQQSEPPPIPNFRQPRTLRFRPNIASRQVRVMDASGNYFWIHVTN